MELIIATRHFDKEEWQNVVSQFEDLSLIQQWAYGESKTHVGGWEVVRHIFSNEREILGAAQGVVKRLPLLNKGIVWINRAPIWKKENKKQETSIFFDMLVLLKEYWVDQRKMYLRVAPTIQDNVELNGKIIACGFEPVEAAKWHSERIDLTQTEEILRKGLKQKWRNCLNKSEKLGISYEIGNSQSMTNKFIYDYHVFFCNKKYHLSMGNIERGVYYF